MSTLPTTLFLEAADAVKPDGGPLTVCKEGPVPAGATLTIPSGGPGGPAWTGGAVAELLHGVSIDEVELKPKYVAMVEGVVEGGGASTSAAAGSAPPRITIHATHVGEGVGGGDQPQVLSDVDVVVETNHSLTKVCGGMGGESVCVWVEGGELGVGGG